MTFQPGESVFYHNPRCAKSRVALELLEDRDIEPRIVLYLKTPPQVPELEEIAKRLGEHPRALLRTKEKIFQDLAVNLDDPSAIFAAIAAHPVLLERPIFIHGGRAVIGRPPNRVLELLGLR